MERYCSGSRSSHLLARPHSDPQQVEIQILGRLRVPAGYRGEVTAAQAWPWMDDGGGNLTIPTSPEWAFADLNDVTEWRWRWWLAPRVGLPAPGVAELGPGDLVLWPTFDAAWAWLRSHLDIDRWCEPALQAYTAAWGPGRAESPGRPPFEVVGPAVIYLGSICIPAVPAKPAVCGQSAGCLEGRVVPV